MTEIDGPPWANFEDRLGQKFYYTTYGLASSTPAELLQMYANQREVWRASGHIVVWRQRPILTTNAGVGRPDEPETWVMTFRMCLLPHDPALGTLPLKAEGAPFQYFPIEAML